MVSELADQHKPISGRSFDHEHSQIIETARSWLRDFAPGFGLTDKDGLDLVTEVDEFNLPEGLGFSSLESTDAAELVNGAGESIYNVLLVANGEVSQLAASRSKALSDLAVDLYEAILSATNS